MSRVAIIPARGGSVRIPRKNIREFMGKPMMQWPIEAAQASGLFDMVIVSTDDQEISDLALRLTCFVHWRDIPDDGYIGTQELAGRVLDQFDHLPGRALERFGRPSEACVIYPCTPMLEPDDLRSCRAAWMLSGELFSRAVIAGTPSDAGAMYWGLATAFRQRVPLESSCIDLPVDDERFIDINTPTDWAQAESLFTALRRANP